MDLERGAPVTFVLVSGFELMLGAGEVFAIADDSFMCLANQAPMRRDQEGVAWARGWHDRTTSTGQALLAAAQLLYTGQVVRTQMSGGTYVLPVQAAGGTHSYQLDMRPRLQEGFHLPYFPVFSNSK